MRAAWATTASRSGGPLGTPRPPTMSCVGQQSYAYVEEPVDHFFQGLAREVPPIAAHLQTPIPSPSAAHSHGEEEQHLELVMREAGGDVGKIPQQCNPSSRHETDAPEIGNESPRGPPVLVEVTRRSRVGRYA